MILKVIILKYLSRPNLYYKVSKVDYLKFSEAISENTINYVTNCQYKDEDVELVYAIC